MTRLPIGRQLLLDQIAQQHHKTSAALDRQIPQHKVSPLLTHRA
jgi:hypothetical protein